MKKTTLMVVLVFAVILSVIAAAGCTQKDNPGGPTDNNATPGESLTLMQTTSATATPGETLSGQDNGTSNGNFTSDESMTAKAGDTVYVYYRGTLDNGSVFDESINGTDSPFTFILGEGQVISGFNEAVTGMKEGETKTVSLSPDEAYGEYNPSLVFFLNRSKFPENTTLKAGTTVYLSGQDGTVFPTTVVNITDSDVLLDANSPLAGNNLTFEITLDRIERPE
ncbi:peptidylprolyl isomerase [Methanomicrobium sp. W14]|uniref:FKBP-type peptidyl-prolyl cis-trans isomerase n=1 Tax=Methanomicrobium sp. W14 TaxID=2817839 RepID=UPI001AE8E8FB|nr:peptidylprolyl isomerase [Methanomicrobium sp. W14]MBP2132680.1 peptidylprolyl isomerase [Methanomicrobium sp. W14]